MNASYGTGGGPWENFYVPTDPPVAAMYPYTLSMAALSLDPQPLSWYQIRLRMERDRPGLPSWHELSVGSPIHVLTGADVA